jgi:hypothetical protein
MTQPSHQVTKLLKDWSGGDESVPDQLIPLVYEELRRLAHHLRTAAREWATA